MRNRKGCCLCGIFAFRCGVQVRWCAYRMAACVSCARTGKMYVIISINNGTAAAVVAAIVAAVDADGRRCVRGNDDGTLEWVAIVRERMAREHE